LPLHPKQKKDNKQQQTQQPKAPLPDGTHQQGEVLLFPPGSIPPKLRNAATSMENGQLACDSVALKEKVHSSEHLLFVFFIDNFSTRTSHSCQASGAFFKMRLS
jgi:hypothetical protein